MDSDLETFIELKFFPPKSTNEYVDSLPTEVQEGIFNNTNLSDFSYNSRYTTREGVQALLETYQEATTPTLFNYALLFVLRKELTEYYKNEQ